MKGAKTGGVPLEEYMKPLVNALEDGRFSFISDEINETNVIILATSLIDYYLRISIICRFRVDPNMSDLKEIFDGYGPLANFNSKIRICHILGLLIPDMRSDLLVINKIRNLFAHSTTIRTFNDKDINSRCLRLKSSADLTIQISSIPKRKFIEACNSLCWQLMMVVMVACVESESIMEHRVENLTIAHKRVSEFFIEKGLPPLPALQLG